MKQLLSILILFGLMTSSNLLHANDCAKHGQSIKKPLKSGQYDIRFIDNQRVVFEVFREMSTYDYLYFTLYDADENIIFEAEDMMIDGIPKPIVYKVGSSIVNKTKTGSSVMSELICARYNTDKEQKAKNKENRIYNNCLLDKTPENASASIRSAAKKACKAISKDPSLFQSMKYN